jgi:hypothetical protein
MSAELVLWLRAALGLRRAARRANELTRDIVYLVERNLYLPPCKWRAKGAEILLKINRPRAALVNTEAVSVIELQLRIRTMEHEAISSNRPLAPNFFQRVDTQTRARFWS